MSDTQNFGFGKFVPGFDFLQNLAKGATDAMPQMPNLSSWVAPTLSVEDLDKRIGELRAVHFWLEQNARALAATVQALEVQKMTLATLKGMNFSMAELASAMQVKPPQAGAAEPAAAAAPDAQSTAAPAPEPQAQAQTQPSSPGAQASGSVVDPLQWWSSLTQQFQAIASTALQEAAQHAGSDAARTMAQAADQALKTATSMTEAAAGTANPAPAPGPAKSAGRKSTSAKPATRAAATKTARKSTGRSRA